MQLVPMSDLLGVATACSVTVGMMPRSPLPACLRRPVHAMPACQTRARVSDQMHAQGSTPHILFLMHTPPWTS
jgi:hypothetical protein